MLNLKIIKILVLIYFIFLSYGYVIAGERNLACDVNVIWVGNGNTYNKKRIIKLKTGKESIQLEGQILKYTFDKYLDNKQIIIGIKNENNKAFSSMSLRLDTMRYKAILSFEDDEEYHYGYCF